MVKKMGLKSIIKYAMGLRYSKRHVFIITTRKPYKYKLKYLSKNVMLFIKSTRQGLSQK